MPNKNNAKWLPKSIDSILDQTYKNWELIIVDDHSTDDSVRVIKEFMDKDSRIDCICDPDVSYPLTKNIGFENSSGKYVVFLDSDDWLGKEFLERGVKNIKNVDGYASSFAVWFGGDKYRKFIFENGVFSNIDALKLKFRFGNGNTMLRRIIIEKYGIRFPVYKRSEDMYFYTLYLSNVHKIFVDNYVGFYVNRGSEVTLTRTGEEGIIESIKVYNELFKILSEQNKDDIVEIVRRYNYVTSLITYVDSLPRSQKLKYGIKYLSIFVRFIFDSNGFYLRDWALASIVDAYIPVKWLLRRLVK